MQEFHPWGTKGLKTIHLSYHRGRHYNSVRSKADTGVGPAKSIEHPLIGGKKEEAAEVEKKSASTANTSAEAIENSNDEPISAAAAASIPMPDANESTAEAEVEAEAENAQEEVAEPVNKYRPEDIPVEMLSFICKSKNALEFACSLFDVGNRNRM